MMNLASRKKPYAAKDTCPDRSHLSSLFVVAVGLRQVGGELEHR